MSTSNYKIPLTDRGVRRTPTFDAALETVDGLLKNQQTPSGSTQKWGDIAGGGFFQSTSGGNITLAGGDLDITGQSIIGLPAASGSSDVVVSHITTSIPTVSGERTTIPGWFNDGTLKYMAIRRTAGTSTQVRVRIFNNSTDLSAGTNGRDIIQEFGGSYTVSSGAWIKGPLLGLGSADFFGPLNTTDADSTNSLFVEVLNDDTLNVGTFEVRFVGEPSTISLI